MVMRQVVTISISNQIYEELNWVSGLHLLSVEQLLGEPMKLYLAIPFVLSQSADAKRYGLKSPLLKNKIEFKWSESI